MEAPQSKERPQLSIVFSVIELRTIIWLVLLANFVRQFLQFCIIRWQLNGLSFHRRRDDRPPYPYVQRQRPIKRAGSLRIYRSVGFQQPSIFVDWPQARLSTMTQILLSVSTLSGYPCCRRPPLSVIHGGNKIPTLKGKDPPQRLRGLLIITGNDAFSIRLEFDCYSHPVPTQA